MSPPAPLDSNFPQTEAVRASREVDLGAVADLPADRGSCAEAGAFSLALFRSGEEVHALENACPHRGGPLCEGDVKEGVVFCPLHAWGFDLRSGRAVNVRWQGARVFPVRIEAGRVLVTLPESPGIELPE